MNSSLSFTDPGAILGGIFLRIAQIILVILAVGAGYMAYLGSEGLFSDWNIEMDSDLVEFFPGVAPKSSIIYLFLDLALKFLFCLGILACMERKI